jgi:hypothetical protein
MMTETGGSVCDSALCVTSPASARIRVDANIISQFLNSVPKQCLKE